MMKSVLRPQFRSGYPLGLSLVVLLFGAGCESDAQPPAGSSAPTTSQTDDAAPEAENPLIRGVQQALGNLPLDDAATSLEDDLETADGMLSRIKRENYEALRQANRQVRLRGHGSPNVLMIVAEGVRLSDLGCYGDANGETPAIDRLAQEGVRFTHYRAPVRQDVYWQRLLTGKEAEAANGLPREPAIATLPGMLWQAGYGTYLMGDCSAGGLFAEADPRDFGFDDWMGLRKDNELDDPYPTHLETAGGARLRILDNAEGQEKLPAGELFTKAAKSQLARLRKGRPFFLVAVYPPLVSQDADALDRHVSELVTYYDALGLGRCGMVVFTGTGDESAAGDEVTELASPAPMIVKLYNQQVRGVVSDYEWSVEDLFLTLADGVAAIQRPRDIQGASAWPEIRRIALDKSLSPSP